MRALALCLLAFVLPLCSEASGHPDTSTLYKRLRKYEDMELHQQQLQVSSMDPEMFRDGLDGTIKQRLPNNLRPLHYDLSLQIYHWGNMTFIGRVTLQFQPLEPVVNITLNSAKLTIEKKSVKLTDSQNSTLGITDVTEDPASEQLTVVAGEPLQPGHNYSLTIHYTGTLRMDVFGLYTYGYFDNKEVLRMVVATQLQATFARHVFPCLDEPAFKARFTLHIARPANSTSVSNTPLLMTSPFIGFPEYEWDTFETTVNMPTYLLGLFITQFEKLSATHDGIDYKVYMKEEHYKEGQYTLDQTPKFVKYFEKYYGIPYPLSKLDSIGCERTAAAGMENWGLVLYSQDAIRIRNSSDVKKLLDATNLIAHEVAHQWFGNLVTARWWSDVWLNEGFATYMAIRAIHLVEPTWEAMNLFVSGHQMTAMAMDSTNLSTPVIQQVTSVEEIYKTFNVITYSKGASLIRMMDHFLTEQTFRRGIRNYLLDYQYSGAVQDDLWRHLTVVGREDGTLPPNATVKQIMDTWTLQKHYPVVTLERHSNGSCTISQKQFSSEQDYRTPKGLWWIPISVLTEGTPDVESTTTTLWLPPSHKTMFVAGLPAHPKWIILNLQQTAYARIKYDQGNWRSLVRQLNQNHTVIPATTRAQLLDDAYALFVQGELSDPDMLFTMMSYMKNEEDYLPWVVTIRNMEDIHDHLLYQPEFFELKTYLSKLSEKLYFKFGFERHQQTNIEELFSIRAQKWACELHQKTCTDDLKNYFYEWQQEQNIRVVPPRLRPAVMCTGIREGNSSLWDSVWSAAKDLPLRSRHRNTLLMALGCSKEPWTLKRYLVEGFKNRQNLGGGGLHRLVSSVSQNPVSYDYAWEIIKDVDGFSQRFGEKPLRAFVVEAATMTLNKRRHLLEMQEFRQRHSDVYGDAEWKKIITPVKSNVEWLDRYHAPIAKWLVAHYPYDNMPPQEHLQDPAPRKSYRSPRKLNIRLIQ